MNYDYNYHLRAHSVLSLYRKLLGRPTYAYDGAWLASAERAMQRGFAQIAKDLQKELYGSKL